jgi:hypothetical protein
MNVLTTGNQDNKPTKKQRMMNFSCVFVFIPVWGGDNRGPSPM